MIGNIKSVIFRIRIIAIAVTAIALRYGHRALQIEFKNRSIRLPGSATHNLQIRKIMTRHATPPHVVCHTSFALRRSSFIAASQFRPSTLSEVGFFCDRVPNAAHDPSLSVQVAHSVRLFGSSVILAGKVSTTFLIRNVDLAL